MKVEQYTCDVCGVVKRDVNHWYCVAISAFNIGDRHLKMVIPGLALIQFGGESELDKPDKVFHLCGQECVLKKVTEFMNGGSNDEKRNEAS